MERVFLAFSYRVADRDVIRPLVEFVEAALMAHGIRAISGENVEGAALTPAIISRIEQCDAVIAILTPDHAIENGKFTAHTWVRDELNHARSRHMRCMALMHHQIKVEGAWQDHEYLTFNPEDKFELARRLVQTIVAWKKADGRMVRCMLLPDKLGARLMDDSQATCEFRLIDSNNGTATDWRPATVSGQVGGCFAYVTSVQDDNLLEIRIKIGHETWVSKATPQFVNVNLVNLRRQR